MTRDEAYKILGLPRTATQNELKSTYRKLAMQYHPDKNLGKEKWAEEKFKKINEAYSILTKQPIPVGPFSPQQDLWDMFFGIRNPFPRGVFGDLNFEENFEKDELKCPCGGSIELIINTKSLSPEPRLTCKVCGKQYRVQSTIISR